MTPTHPQPPAPQANAQPGESAPPGQHPRQSDGPVHILIVAAEPSGDALGAQLLHALKAELGARLRFTGVGGDGMIAEGLRPMFPLSDTAVMGLKQVAPKVPIILRRVREVSQAAERERPDAVVLIDAPDFTHRIARRLSNTAPDLLVIKYVAPQVWASRPWRAKSLKQIVDHLLALLPFEVAFFEKHGLATSFVGHPVLERESLVKGGRDFRVRHRIHPDVPVLALLPGSRSNEIAFLLPTFEEVVAQLHERFPDLVTVLPTVPHVAAKVRSAVADWDHPPLVVEGSTEKFAAFDASTAALAASGTVTTELAIARVPLVVAYKVGWFTALVARRMLTVEYVSLVNLLLEREAVPEFLQERCSPDLLTPALAALLDGGPTRDKQMADLDEALTRLGRGGPAPSSLAARAVLDAIERHQNERQERATQLGVGEVALAPDP